MTKTAKGAFEVTLTAQDDGKFDTGRMTIEKTFTGDMHGHSLGQMLSHRAPVQGSAGYVALEHFNGSVGDKMGGFTLLHKGTMTATSQELKITIVPDSGTGELEGISGTMSIDIKDGAHFYTLDYSF